MNITKIQPISRYYSQPIQDGRLTSTTTDKQVRNENFVKIPLATYQTSLVSFGSSSRVTAEEYYNAAAAGDLNTVKRYIEQGGNVNVQNQNTNYRNALYIAAVNNRDNIIRYLASVEGLNPNKKTTNEDDDCDSHYPLGIAVLEDRYDVVKELLKIDGINPNIRVNKDNDDDDYTLLFTACVKDFNMFNLLLKHPDIDVNAKITTTSERPYPIIFELINDGESDMLEALLETGKVDLSLKNEDGKTPMEYAKDCEDDEAVRILKKYKNKQMLSASSSTKNIEFNSENLTPENNIFSPKEITNEFIKLSQNNDKGKSALEFLQLTPLVDFELNNKAALKAVLNTNNLDFIEAVFKYRLLEQEDKLAEYNHKRSAFISSLAAKSYEELLGSKIVTNTPDGFQYLMRNKKFDPNAKLDGKTLFAKACEIDSTGDLVKYILNTFDNVETKGIKTNNKEIKKLITEYNTSGKYSVKLNNFRFGLVNKEKGDETLAKVKEFVKSDEFKPEYRTLNDNDILHVVANSHSDGSSEVIALAIEKGADINSQNGYGQTPLMIALKTISRIGDDKEQRRHIFRMIQFMLEKGASVYAQDNEGKTVLHYACASKSPTALKLVLSKNPNVHTEDKQGKLAKYYLDDPDMKQVYKEYMQKAMAE